LTAPEPPVDELVAQAEQRRAASARLPEIIANTTGTAMDERRLVEATTNASGELRALSLHPAALSFGGKELGRMIIEAAHLAAEYARQYCFNQIALILGDAVTLELEELIGPSPARAAGWDIVETAEPSAVAAPTIPDDPDDPLSFDPSTLRSDR
jgi:DNA-binding protein YbaB